MAAPGAGAGAKEAPLPSHTVPASVMQLMAKVKVRPKAGEADVAAGAPLQQEAARPREFNIRLDLAGKRGLGLDVDWGDGKTLFIKSVKPEGAVADWNAACQASSQVRGGDRVVAINGQSGDPKAMLAECRSKSQLHLVIRTEQPEARLKSGLMPSEFSVKLDMTGKAGLGLDVDWSDGKTLYVKSVKPGGAVSEWNGKCSPEELVRSGDRVVSINDKTGDPKAMLAECRNRSHLQLLMRRPQASPAKPGSKEPAQDRLSPGWGEVKLDSDQAPSQAKAQRVLKPHEFVVWLDMTRQSILGLDVDWADGKTLYINSVQPGAIQDWNHDHPVHQQVVAGDRIVAVNGYADDPETMAGLCKELCSTQCRFQLLVRGPPPPPPSPTRSAAAPEEKEARRDSNERSEDKEDEKLPGKEEKKDKKEKKERKDRDEGAEKDDKKERRERREKVDKEERDGEKDEKKDKKERKDKKGKEEDRNKTIDKRDTSEKEEEKDRQDRKDKRGRDDKDEEKERKVKRDRRERDDEEQKKEINEKKQKKEKKEKKG